MLKAVVIVALFLFSMLAFWAPVFVLWALFLGQWSSMFWCGVTAIVSGVAVRLLLEVRAF